MKFKNEYGNIIYTKDDYHKKFDTGSWFWDKNYLEYYKGYLVHRDDGPAEEYPTGNKVWYKNGKLHREDGPACEYFNGDKFWFLNGKKYSEKDYWRIMNIKRNRYILNEI